MAGKLIPMIVSRNMEDLRQRVAPLQFRKWCLWELEGADSRMRLRGLPVDEATLNHATWVLFGSREIPDLHGELRPLYDRSQGTCESILLAMPKFDCEGLVEEAVSKETGAGSNGGEHEEGASVETGAGKNGGAHARAAQSSASAPASPDSGGGGRVMSGQRKRPRCPSFGDEAPTEPTPGTLPWRWGPIVPSRVRTVRPASSLPASQE